MRHKFRNSLIVLLVLGTAYAVNLIYFKPFSINQFFNRSFVFFALKKPEMLSQLRILEQFGITFHQDELDDASLQSDEKALVELKETLATLRSYDRSKLTEQEQLSYDIFSWFMQTNLKTAEQFRYYNYPVNQLFGVQNNFPSFMESTHQVTKLSEAEDYITRLTKVRKKFEQVLEGLVKRESMGILPPTFVVEKVLNEMQTFVDKKPEENILYVSLQTKLSKTSLKSDEQQALLLRAASVIAKDVYPAYQLFIDYFQTLLPKTDQRAGVWKFPDGDAFYRHMIEAQTSVAVEPEALHQLGLDEVSRIQSEMRTILRTEGYSDKVAVGHLMKQLSEDPRFLYPDTNEGRAAILSDYQKIIDEVSGSLGQTFAVQPKAGVRVERIPEFKEKTAPGAYYSSPAFDGSRPGIFYANLFDIKATPKFDMRTLAYHEAVPGHHFQIAIAQETTDLPFFRRIIPFTAYAEGWALYAERVAYEIGLQKDPYDNLGRLQAELFRAVRLVVDTGIHAKKWTREEAIAYMEENTGMANSDVVAEIERYIVMPGQACAYKVGMLKILELREQAKHKLGSRFDIREFHNLVLKNGAMPLTVLQTVVERWMNQKELLSTLPENTQKL